MTDIEINEQVARKLGWTDLFLSDNIGRMEMAGKRKPTDEMNSTVPDYVHDIKAAWELTEKIPHCTLYRGGDWWKCSWLQTDGSNITAWITADTALMAICLAFLKLGDK